MGVDDARDGALASKSARSGEDCRDCVRIIGFVVQQLVLDGYGASPLSITSSEVIRAAVGRLEPDCISLDGTNGTDYNASCLEAVWA
jgi:hypothetical protein